MNNLFLTLYVKLQNLMNREEGQDLVEYALLVCPDRAGMRVRYPGCRYRNQNRVQQHQQLVGVTPPWPHNAPRTSTSAPSLREGSYLAYRRIEPFPHEG